MNQATIEKAIQNLFIGNTYKKSTTDHEQGYPAIVRDVMVYFRSSLGNAIAGSQLEVRMQTQNLIGGEQETMTVTVGFKEAGALADLLFFVSTNDTKEYIRINAVWVTTHQESLVEEIRKRREESLKRAEEQAQMAESEPEPIAHPDETEVV